MRRLLIATAVYAASILTAYAAEPAALAKVTVVFDQALPNVPGKSMKGVLVEYGPGGSSPAHMHPRAPHSSMRPSWKERSAVRSMTSPPRSIAKERISSEKPGDRHAISANASDTEPAKLLAVFVVDTADKELVTPITK